MLNVHVRDHATGRLRGAQRTGLSKFNAAALGGPVQHLFQVSRPAAITAGIAAVEAVEAVEGVPAPLALQDFTESLVGPWYTDVPAASSTLALQTAGQGGAIASASSTPYGIADYLACAAPGYGIQGGPWIAAPDWLGADATVNGFGASAPDPFAVYLSASSTGPATDTRAVMMVRPTWAVHPASGDYAIGTATPDQVFLEDTYTVSRSRVMMGFSVMDFAELSGLTTSFHTVRVGPDGETDEAVTMTIEPQVDHYLVSLYKGITLLEEIQQAYEFTQGVGDQRHIFALRISGTTASIVHQIGDWEMSWAQQAEAMGVLLSAEVGVSDYTQSGFGLAVRSDIANGVDYLEPNVSATWFTIATPEGGTPAVEGVPAAPAVAADYSGRAVYWGAVAGPRTADGGTLYLASGDAALAEVDLTELASGIAGDTIITTAAIDDVLYLADYGSAIRQLVLSTGVVTDLTGVDGSSIPPTNVKLLVNWRGRLVAVRTDDPQNIYASKSGNARNWNYAPATVNAMQAWVLGPTTTYGTIGRPIRCLIPFSDDILIVGTDSSIHALRGDPADGGSVSTVTEGVGIWGQTAWCIDPTGIIWFYGSGSLWRMAPGGVPAPAGFDSRVRDWLAGFNRARFYIQLQWDTYRKGLWLFVSNVLAEDTPSRHLFWDAEADAVEFHEFPEGQSPSASLIFDGDGLKDRYLLLGGKDGYVRKLDPEALTDDGTAISSYVWLGPVRPAGIGEQALLSETVVTLATATTGVTIGCFVGDDAQVSLDNNASPVWSRSYTAGQRQVLIRDRVRGESFHLKVSNSVSGASWSFEEVALTFEPGGRSR